MAGELAKETAPKKKIANEDPGPSDKQLDAAWDKAPTFFGKEMVMLWASRQEANNFQGPLVKSGFPLVDFFNENEKSPKPNEEKKIKIAFSKKPVETGELVMKWDKRGVPSRLTFTNKLGEVEEVALDPRDPRNVSFDVVRQKDGTAARYEYAPDGEVARGILSKGKDQDRFDFDSGFHVSSETAQSRFALTDDQNARIIENNVAPPKGRRSPTDMVNLKYVYGKPGEEQDGELQSIVYTLANGAIYAAYPDPEGDADWIRDKLSDPIKRR
jgi:hypothetical protein